MAAMEALYFVLILMGFFLLFVVVILVQAVVVYLTNGKTVLFPLSLFRQDKNNPLAGRPDFDRQSVGPAGYKPPGKVSAEVQARLKDLVFPDGKVFNRTPANGAEAAELVCKVYLEACNGPQTQTMPEDLQGVFWMDGNAIPEELATLNYSVYDDEANLLTNLVMYNQWSYLDTGKPGGSFVNALFKGQANANFQNGKDGPKGMMNILFDSKFPMKHVEDYTARPAARLYSTPSYSFSDGGGANTTIQKWTLEPLPGPGINFKRGCYFFGCIDWGSYRLRKVMHTDGTKVQPAYDEFVRYMDTKQKGRALITHRAVHNGEGLQFPAGAEPGPVGGGGSGGGGGGGGGSGGGYDENPVKAADLEKSLGA